MLKMSKLRRRAIVVDNLDQFERDAGLPSRTRSPTRSATAPRTGLSFTKVPYVLRSSSHA
jgi:hypothetical protein